LIIGKEVDGEESAIVGSKQNLLGLDGDDGEMKLNARRRVKRHGDRDVMEGQRFVVGQNID